MATETQEREPLLSENTKLLSSSGENYVRYRRRWFILSVVAISNISNAMIWISFATIANITAAFYHTTFSTVNWLSLVYPLANIPAGFLATWCLDKCGLRAGLLLSTWLNAVGAILRAVSALSALQPGVRLPLVFLGQVLCGCAQPFILSAPTKVAALWFGERERTTANMLGSMSNPIGVLLGSLLAPLIVHQEHNLITWMLVTVFPAAIAVVMATVGVRSSVPPSPPSASADEPAQDYLQGLKQIMCNKDYVILMLCFGCGLGLYTAISSLIEQILCPWGYGNTFSGVCGGLFIGMGVVGAGLVSPIMDRTRAFKMLAKIGYSLAAVAGAMFAMVFYRPGQYTLIAVSIGLFGMFGFSVYPASMELSVECTYPVAEGTVAGLLIISGQVQSVLYIEAMQWLSKDAPYYIGEQCTASGTLDTNVGPRDYTTPSLCVAGLASLIAVVMVTLFNPHYRRLEAEERRAAENVLRYHRHPGSRDNQILSRDHQTMSREQHPPLEYNAVVT